VTTVRPSVLLASGPLRRPAPTLCPGGHWAPCLQPCLPASALSAARAPSPAPSVGRSAPAPGDPGRPPSCRQAWRWAFGSSNSSAPPLSPLPKKSLDLERELHHSPGMRKVDGLLLECTRCQQMLPRGRFRWRAGSRTVKRSWCRECEKPARAAVAARRRERVVGSYTADDVRALGNAQKWECATWYCRRPLTIVGYHVDHKVALAKGGMNVAANLQLLCPRCNLRKGAK